MENWKNIRAGAFSLFYPFTLLEFVSDFDIRISNFESPPRILAIPDFHPPPSPQTNMKALLRSLLCALAFTCAAHSTEVRLEAVPEKGVQPQIAVDSAGTTHLVYLKGDPKGCDVRYVKREKGARNWSTPISVTSEAGSAVAMGTIRGAQLAIGKAGSVHVAWNGAMKPGMPMTGAPLFYARLDATGSRFTPQRDLTGNTTGLDGGASIAANDKGEVFIVWHGKKKGDTGDETSREVFVLKSTDNGATFAAPAVANADYAGTCACCGLKAVAAPGGLITLYRAARDKSQRDMTVLTSTDSGATFSHEMLHPWAVNQCPMSSAALLSTATGVRAAWETDGKIFSTLLAGPKSAPAEVASGQAKHPSVAVNARGETLVAWDIGTGWNRGGDLGWIILDANGQPTAQRGKGTGVSVWSHTAAYAEPSGDFVILR